MLSDIHFTELISDFVVRLYIFTPVSSMQDSHFLSAEECMMAADFQVKHPNPCKLAKEGSFGSKFVTCIVTGKKCTYSMQGYFQYNERG